MTLCSLAVRSLSLCKVSSGLPGISLPSFEWATQVVTACRVKSGSRLNAAFETPPNAMPGLLGKHGANISRPLVSTSSSGTKPSVINCWLTDSNIAPNPYPCLVFLLVWSSLLALAAALSAGGHALRNLSCLAVQVL